MKIKALSGFLLIMAFFGFFWMTACSSSKSTEKTTVSSTAQTTTSAPSASTASTASATSSTSTKITTTTTTSIVVADTSISGINWEKMDRAERMAHMKQVVMPQMREAFRAFDPKKFEKVNCVTCHGDGAKDDSYKMPNPKLPKLPRTKEGWDKIMKEKADMLKFMKEVVKPKMASILGMKPFDMQTKTGFGCGNCHTDEKE